MSSNSQGDGVAREGPPDILVNSSPDENRRTHQVMTENGVCRTPNRTEIDTTKYRDAMRKIEHKLNVEIGFGWWKRYIAAAFWSNLSLPINLSITLMTALTTAQATTDNLLSQRNYVGLSIATLVMSVLNTFFRPHEQMNANVKLMGKWTEFGNRFESVYYSEYSDCLADYKKRLREYEEIQNDVNAFQNTMTPEMQNFMTDCLHIIARLTVLKRRDKWLDLDNTASDV